MLLRQHAGEWVFTDADYLEIQASLWAPAHSAVVIRMLLRQHAGDQASIDTDHLEDLGQLFGASSVNAHRELAHKLLGLIGSQMTRMKESSSSGQAAVLFSRSSLVRFGYGLTKA